MKKQFLFLAGCVLLAASSCNYISNPLIPPPPPPVDCDDMTPKFPNYNSKRVILLEDYTGHTCLACPQAADTADLLKKKYPGQVVVVAVHAGTFAKPDNKKGFPQDFITDAGKIYDGKDGFDVSRNGNPKGLINRKDFVPLKTTHLKSFDKWTGEVKSLMNNTVVEADLQIVSEYNSTSRNACIFIQYKLPATLTGNYKLSVMLIQDSIKGPQYVGSATNLVKDYVFRDMLRDNINKNGTWGDDISVGSGNWTLVKYGYTVQNAYKGIECLPKHCHIVAFIYDDANKRILQAAEVKLKE